jgi:hypothetical protein
MPEDTAMYWSSQVIWIALVAIAVLVIIGLIAAGARRARTESLRDHFGSEYERALKHAGSRTSAEEELAARAEEVRSLDIRPLSAAERERYESQWATIERRFVQGPTMAVVEADEMIADVMQTRGYPIGDFEKHAAHLSVDHPRVVEHYRAGHGVIDEHARGRASTEELRKAMLHYRELFRDLVLGREDVERPIESTGELAREREHKRIAREEIRDEERR